MHHSPAPAKYLSALLAAMMLCACAIKPEPITTSEIKSFATDRVTRVDADQEPIRGAVSLHEAMARALKYNLDTRVEMAQSALKIKELDLSEYKLLPNIVANSGYAGRDNTSSSNSRNLATGLIGTNNTTSTERDLLSADLSMSWNVLDFGLSYVKAQQLGDEALIAVEARRKIANRVIEDVRTAYWRAVTYQRLIQRLRGLEGRALRARSAARTLYDEGKTQPTLALSYERELVEVRREIQKVEGDLIVAKSQLAALMNLRPGISFTLVDSRSGATLVLSKSADKLVQQALENRPEMHEIAYRLRINQKEATAALLELLPGAQLYLGGNFDSNRFLLNNNWLSYGAKASWNLMKLVAYPAKKDVLDAQDKLLDQRSLALTMAIMTQVHVSRARYTHAQRELHTTADYLNIQNDILAQVRAQAQTDKAGEQALIREEMNALLAEVRYDLAHAQMQNAFANVYTALGLDPFDSTINLGADVKTISIGLQKLWQKRGDAMGAKSKNLLRAPRKPRALPANATLPPQFGQQPGPNTNSALQPPTPAPGITSRSVGGTFLAPSPIGQPPEPNLPTHGINKDGTKQPNAPELPAGLKTLAPANSGVPPMPAPMKTGEPPMPGKQSLKAPETPSLTTGSTLPAPEVKPEAVTPPEVAPKNNAE
jgi:outer membrane protein TolC